MRNSLILFLSLFIVSCNNSNNSKEKFQEILNTHNYGLIQTEIKIIKTFFYAEEYHQKYLYKNPNGYCGLKGLKVNYN